MRSASPEPGKPVHLEGVSGARYQVVAITHEGRVLGRLMLGPFVLAEMKEPPASLMELAEDLDEATLRQHWDNLARIDQKKADQLTDHVLASLDLLIESDWRANVERIERGLKNGLAECEAMPQVAELRCLGAIGVVEMNKPVAMTEITRRFVAAGVWVRPFGKLVYLMPPYVISDVELAQLCRAMVEVIASQND